MTLRRRPAHPPPVERISSPIIVFLTICTARRQRILANYAAVRTLRQCWTEAGDWVVGRYVVMPDHVHLFCAPEADTSVVRWVQFWKAMTTRRWPVWIQGPVWQRNCWDTQMRTDDAYEEKLEYVRWNPVRHRLVSHPDDWPFQVRSSV